MKTLSVIIPTYNRAGFIKDSLDSVLSQKLPNGWAMEVIVIDDDSTDKTLDILKTYGSKIKLIKSKHVGKPGVLRNKAIKQAKGEIIAFQDSDDAWLPNKLMKQLPAFDDPKVVLCYSNALVMDSSGKLSNQLLVELAKLKDGFVFSKLIKENFVSTLTVLVRKSAIESVGYFREDAHQYEDYVMWLRIAAKRIGKFVAIKEPLATYRRHEKNYSDISQLKAISKILGILNYVWTLDYISAADRRALEKTIDEINESWMNVINNAEPKKIPLVSVVMSVFNGERFIKESIESVLNQSFKNFEFIIIDDGSKDSTAEIIRSYNDPRIRLVNQNNHGLVFSFNKGIRLARGKYIARMDADDISLPNRFKKEVALLDKNTEIGLVGTFFQYIDEETSERLKTVMFTPTKHIDIVRMMYLVNPFGHGSIMMRKEAVVQAGGYRSGYEPAEDYDLWHRIAEQWQITQIPEVLYLWRLNPNSISHTKMEIQHAAAARTVNELFNKPLATKSLISGIRDAKYYRNLNTPLSETLYHQYVDQQIVLAFHFLVRGRLFNGYKTFLTAFYYKPIPALRLWKTMLWAPIRYVLVKLRIKK